MHAGQTGLSMFHADRARGTFVCCLITRIPTGTGSIVQLTILKSQTLGNAGGMIGFAIPTTDWDKVGGTIAGQTGVGGIAVTCEMNKISKYNKKIQN